MVNEPKKINLVIVIVIIVVINIVFIVGFNNVVVKEFETSAKNDLYSMSFEEARAFSFMFQIIQDRVVGMADVATNIGHNNETFEYYLERWKRMYTIENIIVADIDGIGLSSTGEIVDISNEKYIELALSGEVQATGIYNSKLSNKTVLAVVAPIYFEGEYTGVVVAEYSILYLTSLLQDSADHNGSSMIVNGKGDILVHTYPFDISFENFQFATFEDGASYKSVLNDFSEQQTGSVTFSIGDDRKFGQYFPLGIEDWSLFFEISESTINESVDRIVVLMVSISACIVFSFLFLIVYILITRRNTIRAVEKVAYYDKLTGISNLIKFKLDVDNLLRKPNFDKKRYSLIKSDLSNFKAINEVYGFEVGNKVICTMAKAALTIKSDILHVARIGTDEFIILAENDSIEEFLLNKNIFNVFLKRTIPEVEKHIFNFRYGRYFIEAEENNIDNIVNKVSLAHSFARAESGTAVWDYDEKFNKHLIRLTELTNRMKDALITNEFNVFLQPKHRLVDETIVGAEALVRWIEPGGNTIYPGEFIPLFEKNEFIIQLDKYMFEVSCKFLKNRLDLNKSIVPISINFSRLHLQNPNFVHELNEIAKKYEVPPKYLEIELTETTVIENIDILNDVLIKFSNLGFKVSVDDFGSGYSSLGMLKDYKVDVIKLDRSFFTNLNSDESGKIVVGGIIDLGHNLGLTIVAEGIETKEQVALLKSINCDVVQGYYFNRPMPIEDFDRLLGQ